MPALVHGEQLRGDQLTVPLGVSPYSPQTQKPAVVGLDFTAVPHLALAGPTNCGKTTTLVQIAYQLAQSEPAQRCQLRHHRPQAGTMARAGRTPPHVEGRGRRQRGGQRHALAVRTTGSPQRQPARPRLPRLRHRG